jgi:hypothetical protein
MMKTRTIVCAWLSIVLWLLALPFMFWIMCDSLSMHSTTPPLVAEFAVWSFLLLPPLVMVFFWWRMRPGTVGGQASTRLSQLTFAAVLPADRTTRGESRIPSGELEVT